MQAASNEFERLGAKVVAVSFVKPERLKQYLSQRELSMEVLADPQRKAYRAFGLERANWRRMLRPRALVVYLKLVLQGKMPRRPQEDVHQLGGDFILNAVGEIVFAHRSEDPTDRPSTAQLLEAIAGMQEAADGS